MQEKNSFEALKEYLENPPKKKVRRFGKAAKWEKKGELNELNEHLFQLEKMLTERDQERFKKRPLSTAPTTAPPPPPPTPTPLPPLSLEQRQQQDKHQIEANILVIKRLLREKREVNISDVPYQINFHAAMKRIGKSF